LLCATANRRRPERMRPAGCRSWIGVWLGGLLCRGWGWLFGVLEVSLECLGDAFAVAGGQEFEQQAADYGNASMASARAG
jgi:hypothetical protein